MGHCGTTYTAGGKREEEVEKCSRNLAQHVVSLFRTKPQLTYEPKANHTYQKNRVTPLTVGMALTSYQANRARFEVDTLNDMHWQYHMMKCNVQQLEWL